MVVDLVVSFLFFFFFGLLFFLLASFSIFLFLSRVLLFFLPSSRLSRFSHSLLPSPSSSSSSCFVFFFFFSLISLQVSNEGTTGAAGTVCTFRPGQFSVGSVSTTCIWKTANSAVRGLAGFLTLALWWLFVAKIGWWRTTRKIVYIVLVCMSWVGSTCWLVLAGWDANEVRLANNACKAISNAQCHFGDYIATVIVDMAIWLLGWAFSIVFSVWLSREDFRRPVGMCAGPKSSRGGGGRAGPEPSAPDPAEMDDF